MKVGYQGVEYAYSYIASNQMFKNCEYFSFKSFLDVIYAVENNEVDYGVLPIENSYAGRVAEIHNLLKNVVDKNIFFVKEKLLKIEHCLCGIKGSSIDNITNIFSHEQALMQCQKTILKLVPNAVCKPMINTAVSAKFVYDSNNINYASICSKYACERYNLSLLKENFQDLKNDNYTLFVALSKKQNNINSTDKNVLTSLIFELKNCVGALYYALGCFNEQNIDIVKIESYIPPIDSTISKFFITIKGNIADIKVKSAIEKLKQFTNNIYILGSYLSDR